MGKIVRMSTDFTNYAERQDFQNQEMFRFDLKTEGHQQGCNVTCDNLFIFIDLVLRLADKKCTLVGIMRQNRREVSLECKKSEELHATEVFRYNGQTAITLTSCQCKASKNMAVLYSLHPDVQVPRDENQNKKTDSVRHYNITKVEVDVDNQMIKALLGEESWQTVCRACFL